VADVTIQLCLSLHCAYVLCIIHSLRDALVAFRGHFEMSSPVESPIWVVNANGSCSCQNSALARQTYNIVPGADRNLRRSNSNDQVDKGNKAFKTQVIQKTSIVNTSSKQALILLAQYRVSTIYAQ